jgi:hypothetical protein
MFKAQYNCAAAGCGLMLTKDERWLNDGVCPYCGNFNSDGDCHEVPNVKSVVEVPDSDV